MKIDTDKFFLMISQRMVHQIDYMHPSHTIQSKIVDLLDNL